ncbi:MAG: AMP-binding protein [Acidobacteria bacterium]|nr:MAG: AMP-binding protein [Acidobacteriota bacterium]
MPRRTILEYLNNFERFGPQVAYVQRRGYRTERWTYREVFELSAQLARELEARGINKGDRVLLWSENSAQWVAAFFGCALRGAVAVPMDRIAAPEFARRVAQQTQAKLALCSRELLPQLGQVPALDLEAIPQLVAGRSSAPYAAPPLERSDVVEIVFTSGSTAEPKGVVITHGNILANLETFEPEIAKYLKYERLVHPIRFLNLLPLSHVFGQFLGIFIPQLIGGTVLFQESLNPSEVVQAIHSERISVLVTVPRLLQSLKEKIEREEEAAGRLSKFHRQLDAAAAQKIWRRWWSFRRIHRRLGWKFWALISGGATLDNATEEFWRRLGYAVIQGYGLTETTSLISVNHPFRLGRGSIGKALPGREIKLSPEGEILVRGESVASGYLQAGQLRPVLGEEGWFHTGDLGALDEQGNLYFKGRRKQVIVTPAGLNIYPEDLEAALRRQPEVRDCAVVALARNGNAEPAAAVIPRDSSAEVGAAVARANSELAQHQQIRDWFVWPQPDFPRTPTQKIRIAEVQRVAENRVADGRVAQPPSAVPGASGPLGDLLAKVRGARRDAKLEDELNLTSLDRVELMSALEDRYEVDLDDQRFSEAKTVGQLEAALRESAPRQSDYQYPRWAQRWPIPWLRFFFYYLLTWPVTLLFTAPQVTGRENLRGVRGPLLVISNHVTYIDIGFILFALPPRLRHQLAAAMRGELLFEMRRPPRQWFFLRRWWEQLQYLLVIALFNVFPLPQRSGFRQSFAFAGELADRGNSVLIFPEGARTPDGAVHAFRSGIGLLAARLRLPVLPMKIEGLYELKSANRHFAPGKVRVKIGAPVSFSAEDNPERITRELEQRLREL